MKSAFKFFFTILFAVVASVSTLVGCQKDEGNAKAVVVECTADMLVIQVEDVEGEVVLLSVMQTLQEEEKLSFEIVGGMITEINGKANAVDYSSCWMLYTSDAELDNTEWGTLQYQGQTIGSAIVGADSLPVVAGAYYVWSYQSF